MQYREGADLGESRVRRGGGGGGRGGRGIAVGGIGGIIIVVIVVLLGGDPGALLGGGGAQPPQPGEQQQQSNECRTVEDVNSNRDCRWDAYDVALQNYWSQTVDGFTPASEQLFSGQISTGCGTGSSQMGPFYCPSDQTIYLDTDFMGQLLQQLGTERSDPAELYIVAHEYGHHISNLTGVLAQANQDRSTGPTSSQVRVELQADCYAGVFFYNTNRDPQSPVENVTQDDLNKLVEAARAVGDDHIQESQTGQVSPESWTHGSSQMRQRWLTTGFETGDPQQCDTFATDEL